MFDERVTQLATAYQKTVDHIIDELQITAPGSLIFFGVREIAKKTRNLGVVMVLAISRNLA